MTQDRSKRCQGSSLNPWFWKNPSLPLHLGFPEWLALPLVAGILCLCQPPCDRIPKLSTGSKCLGTLHSCIVGYFENLLFHLHQFSPLLFIHITILWGTLDEECHLKSPSKLRRESRYLNLDPRSLSGLDCSGKWLGAMGCTLWKQQKSGEQGLILHFSTCNC